LTLTIYRVENELRAELETGRLDRSEFLAARKERIVGTFEELRAWLMVNALAVAPQSKLGKAIAYAQHEFDDALLKMRYVHLS